MKTILKLIAALLLVVVLIITGGIAFIKLAYPKVKPATDLKVAITPERVERGEYLAKHVTVCIDCHSTRDWGTYSGPLVAGTEGKGGEFFDQKFGFPGAYHSKNITPAGIGNWTDGEIYRAITSGVARDGKALFNVMPYKAYGNMADEDIQCIIAYIRTLQPIQHAVPASVSDVPMNIIINTLPQQGHPIVKVPAKSDTLNYGKYLLNAAACHDCHTPMGKDHQYMEELAFAGGFEFPMPDMGIVRSANITPDKDNGIGAWDSQRFVARFKAFADVNTLPKVKKGEFNTIMPWSMYAGMTEEDLTAIFKYLQTLKPINKSVEKFTPTKGVVSN